MYQYVVYLNFVGHLSLKLDDIINRLVIYMMPVPAAAILDDHKFLLPAKCRFLLSDISNTTPLLSGMLYMISFSRFSFSFVIGISFFVKLMRACVCSLKCSDVA